MEQQQLKTFSPEIAQKMYDALRSIGYPLQAMRESAEAAGYVVNGAAANQILADPNHYQLMAREVLNLIDYPS